MRKWWSLQAPRCKGTECLCCLFRGFSWILHLHPAHSLHPTKVHTDLGRWDCLSQKAFYSWIPTYPPNQPDQCQEAGIVEDTPLFFPDHKYFSRPTILLSFWRNNYEWIYACSSVTSASAATLNQMTDFFSFSLSVTVTIQPWWNRGAWCNPLKHLHTSSLMIPNQPFPSGTAGIPLLCIHGGKRSCPELAIIFVLFMPKLEKCPTWGLKTPGWPLLSTV